MRWRSDAALPYRENRDAVDISIWENEGGA